MAEPISSPGTVDRPKNLFDFHPNELRMRPESNKINDERR
jgi:hypothetical protein